MNELSQTATATAVPAPPVTVPPSGPPPVLSSDPAPRRPIRHAARYLLPAVVVLLVAGAYSLGFVTGSHGSAPWAAARTGARPGAALGRPPAVLSPVDADAQAAQVPAGATVNRAANRVVFGTTAVHLVVEASPPSGTDMTFRIAGLTDPTVEVPAGAVVTVQLINADSDTAHGFEVSTAQPPFDDIPRAGLAFPGAIVVVPLQQGGYATGDTTFTAGTPGSYHYLCPIPGHAQQGMYGVFTVTG
jgi:rusticyanin